MLRPFRIAFVLGFVGLLVWAGSATAYFRSVAGPHHLEVWLSDNGKSAEIEFREGCHEQWYGKGDGPETFSGIVRVGPMKFTDRELCEGNFRRSGRTIPGLSFYSLGIEDPTIELSAEFDYKRRHRLYPVAISFGGQMVRRHLLLVTGVTKEHLIYEGSDAFVNYCIDGGHELRSSDHRLYCVAGGHDFGHVVFKP
jgi:hypothetical protein